MARKRFSFGGMRGITRNPIVSGAIGGVMARAGANLMSPWGGPIGTIAAGYLTANPVLQTLGGYQLGSQFDILGMVGMGSGATASTGAYI